MESYVFNDLDERVTSDTYRMNEEGVSVLNISAGTHYKIQVRQDRGLGLYSLNIK